MGRSDGQTDRERRTGKIRNAAYEDGRIINWHQRVFRSIHYHANFTNVNFTNDYLLLALHNWTFINTKSLQNSQKLDGCNDTLTLNMFVLDLWTPMRPELACRADTVSPHAVTITVTWQFFYSTA